MNHDPVASLPAEARAYQGRRAGVVTRTTAAVVDAAVVGLLLAGGYGLWTGVVFLLNPQNFAFPQTTLAFNMTTALVLSVFYLTACWVTTGRTYGDHLLGLRVVGARGKTLGPATALLRAFACAFFPIGLMWCAISRTNSSVQDLVLRSQVIYDWSPQVRRVRALGPAAPPPAEPT